MDPKFGKKITCECGKKWYTLKKTNPKCSCGKTLEDQSIETIPVIQQEKPQPKEPIKKEEDIAKLLIFSRQFLAFSEGKHTFSKR